MTDLAVARHLFSLDEYHQMGAAGILHEDDRVELIEGEIVETTPVGSRHAAAIKRLNRLLTSRAGGKAIVAAGGVHELWLVNLPDRTIEVHREPVHQSYRWTRRAFPGDTLEPERLPGVTVTVDDVFGSA